MIAYGTRCDRAETTEVLKQLKVEPRQYVLYVSRLEPENNAHVVIEAFASVKNGHTVADCRRCSLRSGLHREIESHADARVRFYRRNLWDRLP
jgi:glycosyltransferase involved in cell wall biosynthesis